MNAWSWSWDGGPAYAAHATLGSVIGHEILHAFDLHRRRLPLDPDMNVDQWLWITPESWKKLEARIECVARLYARSFWRKVQFYGNDVAVQVDRFERVEARSLNLDGIERFFFFFFLFFPVRLECDEERERRRYWSLADFLQNLAHPDEREGPEPSRIGGTSFEPAFLHKRRPGKHRRANFSSRLSLRPSLRFFVDPPRRLCRYSTSISICCFRNEAWSSPNSLAQYLSNFYFILLHFTALFSTVYLYHA